MKSQSILLAGCGGHAESCIDVIEQEGVYKIAGLVGLPEEIGKRVLGYPVIGTDDDLPTLVNQYKNCLITIGQIKNPIPRINLFEKLTTMGAHFPVLISPKAYVSHHALLDAGSIVMHGAIVNAGASIGKNCILNSMSLIEHGVTIHDYCHISTSVTINGGVNVGRGTFVGSGSSVKQELKIGENCLIGLGQSVIRDCQDGTRLTMKRRSE